MQFRKNWCIYIYKNNVHVNVKKILKQENKHGKERQNEIGKKKEERGNKKGKEHKMLNIK